MSYSTNKEFWLGVPASINDSYREGCYKRVSRQKTEKGMEEKERGGDIHDCSMCDIKAESMAY